MNKQLTHWLHEWTNKIVYNPVENRNKYIDIRTQFNRCCKRKSTVCYGQMVKNDEFLIPILGYYYSRDEKELYNQEL